jgi:predicted N-acetyltransferase YhbS
MKTTTIRPMALVDAEAIAQLAQAAGYQATRDEVAQRHGVATALPNQMTFVAERGDAVIGWAHVYGIVQLHTAGYAALVTLIVRPDVRRQGVGRSLMDACRRWGQANGFADLRVP